MSIQGSINSLLGMAALGIRLSPGYENRQATLKAKNQLVVLGKQEEAMSGMTVAEGSVEEKIYQDIQEGKKAASKELFELNPSEETFKDYVKSRWYTGEPIMTFKADEDEIRMEQEEFLAQEAESQRAAHERLEHERLAKEREAIGRRILERGRP